MHSMRPSRALLAATLAALASAACGDDEEPPPTGEMVYEVLRYDYAFDIETRAAAAAVEMRVVEGGDCVRIPMRAADLGEVLLDEEPITGGDLTDGVMTACGAGWWPDEEITLRTTVTVPLETWGDSQVGYSVSTDLEGNPFYYLVSWVGGCDRFGPCDSAPDRFAHYRFTVSHPSGTQVLCPGTITPGDTQTTCDFDYDGGPTYSTFAIMASPSWETIDLGSWGGVSVTLYDMPSTDITEDIKVDRHRDFLQWMESHFGPYPYGNELRLASGPTYWAAFEHPGNILLSDQLSAGMLGQGDSLTSTTNHEMSHMWAGNQTTLAGTYDFVWKEAMAQYLPFAFDDESDNPSAAAAEARSWKLGSVNAEYYLVPEEQPPLLDYYGDVYSPGPMIFFRQIEALFDRDAVFEALASLLGEPRFIGVTDVKAALEQATGADLTTYFDTWVYGEGTPTWPEFTVTITDQGGGQVAVTVAQQNTEAGLYGCAFAIELTGDNDESDEVRIDLGTDGMAETTVTATPGFTVTGHVFDPHSDCLAYEYNPTAAAEPPGPRPRPPYLAPVPPVPYPGYY